MRNHPWCSASRSILYVHYQPVSHLIWHCSISFLTPFHKHLLCYLPVLLDQFWFVQTLSCANYFILKTILSIIWEFSEDAVWYILVPRQNSIFWLKQNMIHFRIESCPHSAIQQMPLTSRVTRLHVDYTTDCLWYVWQPSSPPYSDQIQGKTDCLF